MKFQYSFLFKCCVAFFNFMNLKHNLLIHVFLDCFSKLSHPKKIFSVLSLRPYIYIYKKGEPQKR